MVLFLLTHAINVQAWQGLRLCLGELQQSACLEAFRGAISNGPAVISSREGPRPLTNVTEPGFQISWTVLSHLQVRGFYCYAATILEDLKISGLYTDHKILLVNIQAISAGKKSPCILLASYLCMRCSSLLRTLQCIKVYKGS